MLRPNASVTLTVVTLLTLSACNGGRRGAGTDGTSFDEQFQQALQLPTAESRAKRLVQLARRQKAAGDSAGAERSLEAASRACADVEDVLGRATTLSLLADAQARVGMPTDAKTTLPKVRDALEQVDNLESKIMIMARMAITYGQHLDDPESARSLLTGAKSLVDQLDEQNAQVRGLSVLAYAQHVLKRPDDADCLAEEAASHARGLEDPRRRSDALGEVASARSRMSDADQCRALFGEAIDAARQIEDNVSQAHALADLAMRMVKTSQRNRARQVLEEAEDVGDRIADRGLHREVMEKIAQGQAKL